MKIPRGQTPERQAYMKAYLNSHPKRDRRAYKAAYDAKHKDEQAEYRKANEVRLKANKKAYYKANRERILADTKIRYESNPERVLSYQAEYYEKNTDKVKANVSRYRKANPEKKQYLENKRRARKFENGGSHTLEERRERFRYFGNVCYYCRRALPLTVDHAIPLSRGGTDDIENILPSCQSCNSKKNAKTKAEFIAELWSRTNHARIGDDKNKQSGGLDDR